MILISHRGNLNGKIPEQENNPAYVNKALIAGYEVEIDVWFENNKWYLGHDHAQYEIDIDYLRNDKLWCHAKNIEALALMVDSGIHCFWHQTDDVQLTSRGYVWTYPGKRMCDKSICVLPERSSYHRDDIASTLGVCSDVISLYRDEFE